VRRTIYTWKRQTNGIVTVVRVAAHPACFCIDGDGLGYTRSQRNYVLGGRLSIVVLFIAAVNTVFEEDVCVITMGVVMVCDVEIPRVGIQTAVSGADLAPMLAYLPAAKKDPAKSGLGALRRR
jgi:hypothetical protein